MHKVTAFVFVCTGSLGLALLLLRPAAAAWPTDPLVNVPLCTATGDQYSPSMIPDGAGGAIITWYDYRGTDWDIYAQKVSSGGEVQWTLDGVGLCLASGLQGSPKAVSDGAGGAIVEWNDSRTGGGSPGVYAQRILANGTVAWAANGVAASTVAADYGASAITADGAGGAVIAWSDFRTGNFDIYAQRISAGGGAEWTVNGVPVCTATGVQTLPNLVSDGAGGAIVTWQDNRSYNYDVYAQRITAGGGGMWTANGVAVCANTGFQYSPLIASDDANGAIVVWEDGRNGARDIYAQRISGDGVGLWTTDGLAVCASARDQQYPTLVADGASGALFTWQDGRGGYDADIYAQRVTAAGAPAWTVDGVAVCTHTLEQDRPTITSDGLSGAIVSWYDYRDGYGNEDVFAQRISAAGAIQWTADGVAICCPYGEQTYPVIVPDGAHGAIVAWQDGRGTTYDIYAQRVQANGQLGGTVDVSDEVALAFALDPVRPNPSRGGALTVHFTLPTAAPARLELLDVSGRRISSREVGSLGAGPRALDLREGRRLSPGLYLVRLTQGANVRVTRVAVLK